MARGVDLDAVHGDDDDGRPVRVQPGVPGGAPDGVAPRVGDAGRVGRRATGRGEDRRQVSGRLARAVPFVPRDEASGLGSDHWV